MTILAHRPATMRPGSRVVVTGPRDTGETGTVETTSPATARVRLDGRERPAVFPLYELGALQLDDADQIAAGGAR